MEVETLKVRVNKNWGQSPPKEKLPVAKIPLAAKVHTVARSLAKKIKGDSKGSYQLMVNERNEILPQEMDVRDTVLKNFKDDEATVTLLPKLDAA